MPHPAKPKTRINRLRAIPGQTAVLLEALLEFANPAHAAAFKDHLDTGDSATAAALANLGLPITITTSGFHAIDCTLTTFVVVDLVSAAGHVQLALNGATARNTALVVVKGNGSYNVTVGHGATLGAFIYDQVIPTVGTNGTAHVRLGFIGDWFIQSGGCVGGNEVAFNAAIRTIHGTAGVASPAFTGTPTAPTASAGTNTTQIATTAFVMAAVTGLLDFKGSFSGSGNPNYPAASKGDVYLTSVAGKIGGASGKTIAVGDMIVCSADNAGGTEASVGASWFVVEANITGLAALAFLATVGTAQIDNAAVTLAKLANMNANRVIGRNASASGAPEELIIGRGLRMTDDSGGYSTEIRTVVNAAKIGGNLANPATATVILRAGIENFGGAHTTRVTLTVLKYLNGSPSTYHSAWVLGYIYDGVTWSVNATQLATIGTGYTDISFALVQNGSSVELQAALDWSYDEQATPPGDSSYEFVVEEVGYAPEF